MAFTLEKYASLRPTLWHLTHEDNLPLIRETRHLLPANVLDSDRIGTVRRGRPVIQGKPVLRDQDLLHAACVEFTSGWAMDDFLRDQGSRVFFWSGWANRPILQGRKAASRYADTDVIIRVPFLDIARGHEPHFTCCNSGATRMQNGQRVIRGPTTFQSALACVYLPSKVVEVTIVGEVFLPASAMTARSLKGPWEPI